MTRQTYTVARWSDPDGARYRHTVTLELRVGDLAGDLAARGFQTINHEPCPPGTLTLTVTQDTTRNERADSGGAGAGTVPDGAVFLNEWTREKWERVKELGDRWHLNTMRPWCAHMTPVPVGATITWPTLAGPLDLFTVTTYAPSRYAWMHDGAEIEHRDAPRVTCPSCGHKSTDAEHVQVWDAVDHYGANRGQTCPATGYRYGSAWLIEELPADVLEELAALGVTP